MFEFPPHNLDAEQGLLANLLTNNSLFFEAYGTVSEDDFSLPIHGEIFEKIREHVEQGFQASPTTLKNFFDKHPALEHLAGGAYLNQLAACVVSLGNTADYARTIADLAERRRLLAMLGKLTEELRFSTSAARPVAEIKSEILASTEIAGRSVFSRTKHEVIDDVLKALQSPPDCCVTGINLLDQAMVGGLYSGFTYGFAGAAKRGKTTLAHTISHNLNAASVPHAYFALEMGANQIEQRNIARDLQVNSASFLYRNEDVIKRAAKQKFEVKNHTLYFDMAGATFSQLKAEVMRLVLRKKVRGWILDYWQLVGGLPKTQTKADFLYEVAQWCADFSRKHKVFCILIAQLNKDGETFGSSGLEKACDQLYFIEKSNSRDEELWLNMKHSRYTPVLDIGSAEHPRLWINPKGPFIDEIY